MVAKKVVKPKKEIKVEPVKEQVQKVVYEGPQCACGNPVAPGQTYVCKNHMRTN